MVRKLFINLQSVKEKRDVEIINDIKYYTIKKDLYDQIDADNYDFVELNEEEIKLKEFIDY